MNSQKYAYNVGHGHDQHFGNQDFQDVKLSSQKSGSRIHLETRTTYVYNHR